jgi:cytoskeletal protein RodZ
MPGPTTTILLAPTEGTTVPVNKRPKKPMTKGERAAMIFVILCLPVLLLVLGLDIKAIFFTPTAAQPHSSAVPPLVRTVVPTPETARVTDSSSPTGSLVETSPLPAGTLAAAPAVPTAPSPTYTVGTSCTGHREGLREYDGARRLLVCTAGTWTYVQPAGAPADPSTAAPTATTTTSPAPVRTTTSAPAPAAPETTAAPTSTSTTTGEPTTVPSVPSVTSAPSSPTG